MRPPNHTPRMAAALRGQRAAPTGGRRARIHAALRSPWAHLAAATILGAAAGVAAAWTADLIATWITR